MRVLLTGGAGYIGSHTALECLFAGMDVTILDNLSNSSEVALARVQEMAGRSVGFVRGDVRDRRVLDTLFSAHEFDAVIHFAGLKAVGESVEKPLLYYDNNIAGTVVLLEAMADASLKTLVFSSSATVYGDPHATPITEDFPLSATNPYGRSKLFIEEMLRDLVRADPDWSIALLRYFNPVGAHESGLIGEDPRGTPNNLMPYVAQVAIGRRQYLSIFGSDYPTHDGTGVRDYIHVVDLARGHLAAMRRISGEAGVNVWNLGTGRGVSVLEMVAAFESASGRRVPFQYAPRRAGDVAACWANPAKAEKELGWRAEFDLYRMCSDAWRWQSNNPQGYGEKN